MMHPMSADEEEVPPASVLIIGIVDGVSKHGHESSDHERD